MCIFHGAQHRALLRALKPQVQHSMTHGWAPICCGGVTRCTPNLRVVRFTMSFFNALLAVDTDPGYAIELVAGATWKVYRGSGPLPPWGIEIHAASCRQT